MKRNKDSSQMLGGRLFLLAVQLFWLPWMLCGQSNALPSGGTVTNASGTLHFSLGQIDFMFFRDSSGSQLFGVQQPEFPGRLDSLACGGYALSRLEFPYMKSPYSNQVRISYSGGNGNPYASVDFSSQTVKGLTLSLLGGILGKGSGNLTMTLSGTADTVGTARFMIAVGGKSCVLEIPVQDTASVIDSLLCSRSTIGRGASPRVGESFDGQIKLPYQGGKKLKIPTFELYSEGVGGLVLSSDSVELAMRNGELLFRLKGVPDTSGTAVFQIAIGGKFCTLNIVVEGPALSFPNFFSPNNDGVQDIWTIAGLFEDYPEASIRLYDRNGKWIAQMNKEHPVWDGTHDGRPLPAGVYWAQILLGPDRKPITSHLTVLR